MDDDNLARAKQLLGDDHAADRFDRTPACIADNMGVAFLKPEKLGRICVKMRAIVSAYSRGDDLEAEGGTAHRA